MAEVTKSLSKQVLVIFYNHPAEIFSINKLMRFPAIKRSSAPIDTVRRYCDRFFRIKILEKVSLDEVGRVGYRLSNSQDALTYINGEDTKPWLKLPPKPPEDAFPVENRHRVDYKVKLSPEELEIAEAIGKFRANSRTGGSILVRKKGYTLSVNARTGRGQIWLFLGWDSAILNDYGTRLHQEIAEQVEAQTGNRHISIPIEFVNKRIRVGGSDVVVAGSHYPIEFDIQGKESDQKVVKALQMLTDGAKFNRVLLGLEETLDYIRYQQDQQAQAVLKLAEAQLQSSELLSSLSSLLSGDKEGGFPFKPAGKEDYWYG